MISNKYLCVTFEAVKPKGYLSRRLGGINHSVEYICVYPSPPSGSLLDIIKHRSKKDCKNGVLDEFVIATVVKEVLKGKLSAGLHGESLMACIVRIFH